MKNREEKTWTLTIYTANNNGANYCEKRLQAYLDINTNTGFYEIANFQKECKKIYKEAVKVLKSGGRFEMTLTSAIYNLVYNSAGDFHHSETVNFNAWKASDANQSADQGYIYFSPDTKYTRETWDFLLYADIIKSLAEANI